MEPLLLSVTAGLFLLLAIFLTIWCATFYVPQFRQLLMISKLPGPSYVPVIGAAFQLPFVGDSELLKWLKATVVDGYERAAAFWMMGIPVVAINNPEDIEALLSSVKHIEKGEEYGPLRPWLQEGLLTSKGTKWHSRRKMLTPTFHFKILDGQSERMYRNARQYVKRLLEENGRPFNPFKKTSRCTLDIVSEAAMGVSLNSQDNESTEYVETLEKVYRGVVHRIQNMYLLADWLWNMTILGYKSRSHLKILHDFTNNIIAERRAYWTNNGGFKNEVDDSGGRKRHAFLDRLLELDMTKAHPLSNLDIREEVDTFLFEGHDTTATCLHFALFELGHNPDVQEKAYQEQYEIFGDETREVTRSDLQKMTYLERVIKECLRLYPPVSYLSRRLTHDLQLKNFPAIPAGSNMVVMPIFLHRNPKYFENPERFDPDRFLPDETAKRHPFSYIPFSAGPRNCIGQKFAMIEMKVLLSTVIRYTTFQSVTKKSDLILWPSVILRPVKPLFIQVFPRTT